MDLIARITKPPKAGQYSIDSKYKDEDFPPSKFFNNADTKIGVARLGEVYSKAYLYNGSKTTFSMENISPHNAVNKLVRQ
jgi:hypothetical protein